MNDPLCAGYLQVLKEAYCRGPFLLILEDQHALVRHYSNAVVSRFGVCAVRIAALTVSIFS